MDRLTRTLGSIFTGVLGLVAGYMFLMPSGCDDEGGVPSWERCTSAMGLPAFSVEDLGLDATWNILIPLLAGVVVGVVTWKLIGVGTRKGDAETPVNQQ